VCVCVARQPTKPLIMHAELGAKQQRNSRRSVTLRYAVSE